jgi:hypothetical protein
MEIFLSIRIANGMLMTIFHIIRRISLNHYLKEEYVREFSLILTAKYGLEKTAAPTAICAGANLKTYRIAVGCTGEYARAACGTGTNTPTTAQILAKVVTTINRVDGVYETEVADKISFSCNYNISIIWSSRNRIYCC